MNGIGKGTTVIIVTGFLVAGIMLACAPQQALVPLPVSPWGDSYSYSYEPSEKEPVASVPVTIAIVNPHFSENAILDPIYRKVTRGFSKSMAIDLDKVMVAKGMTVTGPFESLDMMTYPDRKNADLSLTPVIFLDVQSRDITGWMEEFHDSLRFIKSVEIKVDAWIALILREPLSSEKIWIKKIQVDEMAENTEIIAERMDLVSKPGYRLYGFGRILYDGRKDAVANMVKRMYPKIMQTVRGYINTEEIIVLKEKAEEIRKLKRCL